MEMDTVGDQEKDQVPKYGLKLALNHEYPLQSKQIIVPSAKQMFDMMPLTTRYLKYYVGRRMNKKKPIMDYIHMISAQRMYGCPIGGIGGGTIGRGYKGEFCRFQLYPGMYDHITVPECQFIVNIQNACNETIFQSVLSTYNKPKKAPPSWEWNLNGADCQYTGLYPRAWTTYNLSKYGVKLVCRQISPVIPHNYKDSSLPCAVFVFTATNVSNDHRKVSITQTWTEITLRANKKKKNLEFDFCISKVNFFDVWQRHLKEARNNEIYTFISSEHDLSGITEDSQRQIKVKISQFSSRIAQKWDAAGKCRQRFLEKNSDWLHGEPIKFEVHRRTTMPSSSTEAVAGPGRPQKEFSDSSLKTKRRRVENLVQSTSSEELLFAAEISSRQSGSKAVARRMKNIIEDNKSGDTSGNKENTKSCKENARCLTNEEALACYIDSKLTTCTYNIIRQSTCKVGHTVFPSLYYLKNDWTVIRGSTRSSKQRLQTI